MIKPSQIRVDASTACQLRCPACPTTQGKIRARLGTGFLRFDRFLRIVDENPWVRSIELSNWGEIFLNPDLLRMMKYAFEKGVRLKAKNGVNFNDVSEEMLLALVRYRFHSLKFSIDGTTPETYRTYRKRGDHARVMANVRRLCALKEEHASEFPRLKWQFIAFGHNEHQIAEAKALAAELGMRFWVKLAWKSADSTEQMSDVSDREMIARETGTGVASRREFYERKHERYMQRHSCTQLWSSPQINWDGRVLGCNILHGGDFGDAFDDGLLAALNGEKISYARRMLMGVAPARADVPCSDCKHYLSMREHGRWIRPADVRPNESSQRGRRDRRPEPTGAITRTVGRTVTRLRKTIGGVAEARWGWLARKGPGSVSRSRGLERFERLFSSERVDSAIERGRAGGSIPRVVEVGCGEGRLLLDLLRRYGDLAAYGINKRPWPAMTGRASFAAAAVRHGVFTRRELRTVRLPEALFYDAESLHFVDASIDLVVSQTAIPYVQRKERLLEEVWRVLRPGGVALLHVDTRVRERPPLLRESTPRFVIREGEREVALAELIEERRAAGFAVRYREVESGDREGRLRVVLEFEKNRAEPLGLGLDYDEAGSFNLPPLGPSGKADAVFWGRRSAYRRQHDRSSVSDH